MTREEKQRGLELQDYIDSIRGMTIKEIAIKHLRNHHLPKFLAGLLVKFSYPLLLAKDYQLSELEKENEEAKNLIEELASSLSVVGECGEEECELINKAQKFINKPIF